MNFRENKNKIYTIWNRSHKSEDDLNYISLKEEGIGKDLIIPGQTINKKINYYTTEWESIDIENQSTTGNNILGYSKSWNIVLQNFPIKMLPFIKTSHLYTSDTNERITYDIQINNQGIKNFIYFFIKNGRDEVKLERKEVTILTGFKLETSESTVLKMLQCKLILAIYNPYSFS